jgi:hypothetical protein
MNLQVVLHRYSEALSKIYTKAHKNKRNFTHEERKGIAWYKAAYNNVQNLINQGPLPTEGFKQYEYVPQHLRFAPKEAASE